MEIFNRVIAMIFGLVILALGVGTALVTMLAAGPYSMTLSTGEQWTVSRLAPSDQLVGVVLGILVALVGIVLCAIEVLGPPRQHVLLATRVKGQQVGLEVSLVRQRVHDDVKAVPGVLDVAAAISQARRGVRLVLRLTVAPSATVPVIVEQAVGIARESMEVGMGLKVDSVRAIVRPEPASVGAGVQESPRFSER